MTLNKLREKMNDLETKAIQDNLTDYVTDIRVIQKTLAGLIEADDAKKAAKGWTKGTGTFTNLGNWEAPVPVYRHKDHPGLFINRGLDRDGKLLKSWYVTHEKSGLYLLGGYSNMKKAALAVEKHLTGLNWDQEAQEIVGKVEYAKAVSEAKKAA